MYIAFYKSNFKWWSRLIKWWSNGIYSHCEIYNNGCLIGISNEQRVRTKKQKLNYDKWDVFRIDFKIENLNKFYLKTKNKKYDWLGVLLSCVFNRKKHNIEKYTCSEWVAEMLDKDLDFLNPKDYQNITPYDLYIALKNKNLIEKVGVNCDIWK